jgi:hypothetical protein
MVTSQFLPSKWYPVPAKCSHKDRSQWSGQFHWEFCHSARCSIYSPPRRVLQMENRIYEGKVTLFISQACFVSLFPIPRTTTAASSNGSLVAWIFAFHVTSAFIARIVWLFMDGAQDRRKFLSDARVSPPPMFGLRPIRGR